MKVEKRAWFWLLLAAIDACCISIAAPLIAVTRALSDGLSTSGTHAVCTEVRGTAGRVPVLVSTAVPAVKLIGRVVAEAVIKTLPLVWTAGRARR